MTCSVGVEAETLSPQPPAWGADVKCFLLGVAGVASWYLARGRGVLRGVWEVTCSWLYTASWLGHNSLGRPAQASGQTLLLISLCVSHCLALYIGQKRKKEGKM